MRNKGRLSKTKHQFAFTLAEVLITLSIIGVVAALIIPSLLVKNQEKQTVVQLKKTYSVLSNAFSLSEIQYGGIDGWDIGTEGTIEGATKLANNFIPFLNIIKNCSNKTGCAPSEGYTKPGGDIANMNASQSRAKAILADGSLIAFYSSSSGCNGVVGTSTPLQNLCGAVSVDVNGFKKPNKSGQDFFYFRITKYGIIPHGTKEDTERPFESECTSGSGDACTAWVLLKENLDYPPAGTGWE